MKIELRMELDKKEIERETGKKITKDEIEEELTQMLFEVCEEWVLRGQQPDLEFK